MTRAELIARLAAQQRHLTTEDVELAVKMIVDQLSDTLARGERIEVRGFGAFSLRTRQSRMARDPRTGEPVAVLAKRVPYFRPGKELRERVDSVGAGECGGVDRDRLRGGEDQAVRGEVEQSLP